MFMNDKKTMFVVNNAWTLHVNVLILQTIPAIARRPHDVVSSDRQGAAYSFWPLADFWDKQLTELKLQIDNISADVITSCVRMIVLYLLTL